MPSVVTMTGPGTATVTDDAAVAITAQTVAITASLNSLILQVGNPAVPGTLIACLSGINDSLTRIADTDQAIAKSVSDINIAIGSLATAQASLNSIQAISAANQIQSNNFHVQVTKDTLKEAGKPEPVLPPVEEQIKTAVKNGISLDIVATANGAVTQFIKSNTVAVGLWISQTAAYQTVASWLESAKSSLLNLLPPSVRSTKSLIKGGGV